MNALNLFKFLEKEKGKPIPVKYKILYGLPLTPEELNVKGSLYFEGYSRYIQIISLPQGLKVGENLDLYSTKITSLPQGLQVGNILDLEGLKIDSLPPDLKVEGSLRIAFTPLRYKSDEEIRAMLTTGYIKGGIIR
jgi:hypothetical protein